MEENNINELLLDKLTSLNDLELNKTKILAAIFLKTAKDLVDKKVQSLESHFKEQAEYYGQYIEDYNDIYKEILDKYKSQLNQLINKYNTLHTNIQLELKEAECNQKIAITNLKKSLDIKQQISSDLQMDLFKEYENKVSACLQKKINYDIIIEECEREVKKCSKKMEENINNLFADKTSQISLKQETGLKKFVKKVMNFFTGANKFQTYVIEPLNIEIEMMENKLPNITNDIQTDTINFVAKIKQAKSEVNTIFGQMLKVNS